MPYSLKVDWTGHRTLAVCTVIAQTDTSGFLLEPWHKLVLYIAPDDLDGMATIKLDATQAQLNELDQVLNRWLRVTAPDLMLRARDNEPGLDYGEIVTRQAQVFAALQDIRMYRATAADVAAELASRTQKDMHDQEH